ncbi:MAG: hypothetical protein HKN76_22295, partial [Saprospiraceae bacterium]|nr:hypothetical protein [Saprospiraceae bacterium]
MTLLLVNTLIIAILRRLEAPLLLKSGRCVISLLFCSFTLCRVCDAQIPTIQDCLGAIPICTGIYTESKAPTGSGNYPSEINGTGNGGISCMDAEVSSIWYTFTVNKTGKFGFILTPNDPNDDYDWALFNITNATCSQIFHDIALQVSCNAAGGETCHGNTGADGKTTYS